MKNILLFLQNIQDMIEIAEALSELEDSGLCLMERGWPKPKEDDFQSFDVTKGRLNCSSVLIKLRVCMYQSPHQHERWSQTTVFKSWLEHLL